MLNNLSVSGTLIILNSDKKDGFSVRNRPASVSVSGELTIVGPCPVGPFFNRPEDFEYQPAVYVRANPLGVQQAYSSARCQG